MKNWIWMHPRVEETRHDWQRQFEQMRAGGIEAACAVVHNGSQALYGSTLHEVAAPLLEGLIPAAADAGVELHAWIVCLRCNAETVQREHPEWYSVSRAGASSLATPPYIPSYQWLCPTRPEVRAYLRATVAELAAYDGVVGVHLDYIRHPDVILPAQLQPKYGLVQDREFPEFDFCYCDVCRAEFRRREGVDPADLEDAPGHPAWVRFRQEMVRETVAEAATAARAAGKAVTAAVFATPQLARRFVRQDWPAWDVDAVLPMIYHHYYERPETWIAEAAREGVEALAGRLPLYAGAFVGELTPPALVAAMAACQAAGAAGVSLFSHRAVTEAHWRALREAAG